MDLPSHASDDAGLGLLMATMASSRMPGWLPHRRLFYNFARPSRFHTGSTPSRSCCTADE